MRSRARLFFAVLFTSFLILPPVLFAAGNQDSVTSPAIAGTHHGWLSLLPPLVAILVALTIRSVIPALFAGIWCGAFLVGGPSLDTAWAAILRSFDTYLVDSVANPDRVRILLFTMMLGGMIGILSRNGGMQGIVSRLTRFASTAVRGQLLTAGLGLVVFFDDVANTLLIGKTMRPLTDRLRISREKLAYLVDSTAAPIAGIAFASTWVGYEVSVIGTTIDQIPTLDMAPYLIFVQSIPYSFYPIITLFMVFAIAYSGRDFGPMYRSEVAARQEKPAAPTPDDEKAVTMPDVHRNERASSALVPILVVVITLLSSLIITGEGDSLQEIVGSADSYLALMWASLLGVLASAAITLARRILTLDQLVDAWANGVGTTLFAVIVLALAWTLADIIQELRTAQYIVAVVGGNLPLFLLPTLSFVLSGVVAFTTGTSWGTMGIMMPLVLPLSWTLLAGSAEMDAVSDLHVFHGTVAGVLSGAIWGDHCSPISDTTILASLASECHHIEHVRTQLPYSMASGICAVLFGTLPVGLGVPWWIGLPLGFAAIASVIAIIGRHADLPADGFRERRNT